MDVSPPGLDRRRGGEYRVPGSLISLSVLKAFPFLATHTGFPKDQAEQLRPDVACMWVGDVDIETTLAHKFVTGSGEWSFKAKLVEESNQVATDGSETRH
jgi:hypothetical protein